MAPPTDPVSLFVAIPESACRDEGFIIVSIDSRPTPAGCN